MCSRGLKALVAACLGLCPNSGTADPHDTDIPVTYRGTWAVSSAPCTEAASVIEITARRISFYESEAYLRYAQLNHATEVPTFVGLYDLTGELSFWERVFEVGFSGQALRIRERTKDALPDAPPAATIYYKRCPIALTKGAP